MHSLIQEWMNQPLSKVFLKIVEDKRYQAYQSILGADQKDLEALRERLKIYHSILDLERLFEGELEEVINEREI